MTHSVRRVINSKIHATNSQEAVADIMAWGKRKLSCYVIPANVHLVMTGFWQKSYQTIINHAALVTPDGMLLVWTLRLLGIKNQKRVDAADLMLVCCDRA
ncbi:WecB/TagA/CpsF family glycosyltransferase [Dactylococcopsis salina]|uniref:WecB/TagA/CpsF family glycosyltransferase n=1 Tax=Dactylococcopsis salina TaxID=292566 RepID=UPI00030DD62D